MKKRFGIILLILLALFSMGAVSHSQAFYVNDFSGVLTDSQEAGMLSAAQTLASATGAQVVVLTVKSLDGKPIEEYALEVARDWGIGDAERDNGVLILLSTGDRKVRVEVGLGLEGRLPDGKTGRLMDTHAIPYYKENDFANGTEQLFYAVLNEVRAEYGLESITPPEANESNKSAQEIKFEEGSVFAFALMFGFYLLFLIPVFVIRLLVRVFTFFSIRAKKGISAAKRYRKNNLSFAAILALFGDSLLLPLYFIGRSSRYGGGGRSGGSRGGGGGFGGGGASRGF